MALTVKKLEYQGRTVSVSWIDGAVHNSIALDTGTDAEIRAKLGADTIILPADPAPVKDNEVVRLPRRRVRTTTAAVTEIMRQAIPANVEFSALLRIRACTPDLANFRTILANVETGRAAGAVAIIQTRVSPANATILADHAIGPTAGTWPMPTITVDNAIVNNVQRRDLVISVTGVAAVTIDWILSGTYETFVPLGDE